MIIKKLRLENIRSYKNEEITFPESTILLSGNIGSGKSTILLSIDFALFGLQKGELNGSTLLRNGTDEGSVELHLDIEEKNVIIKSVLKREKTIKQDNGYIIINEIKKDLAPSDLRYKILSLLNYPKELLTKSKSLIYNYTVYTPQEAMKEILLTDKDSRLDILRKVFDIDKYKRIKENSKIFMQKIREKSKEFEGITYNLENLEKEKNQEEEIFKRVQKESIDLKPLIKDKEKELEGNNEIIRKTELKIRQEIELRNEIQIIENNINNNKNNLNSLKEEEGNIENKIKATDIKEIKEIKEELLKDLEIKIKALEDKHKINIQNISELETKKVLSIEIKEKITNLNFCPLCQQEVNLNHKHKITEQENKKIEQLSSILSSRLKEDELTQKEIVSLKNKLEELKAEKQRIEIQKIKIENLKEKQKKLIKIKEEIEKINDNIKRLNEQSIKFKSELEKFKNISKAYQEQREKLNTIQRELNNLKIRETELITKLNSSKEKINYLDKEIQHKNKAKSNLKKLRELHQYINDMFISLMDLIENQVLLKVHSDFNILFQKWFDVIINNEDIKVTLDKEFTPLILQNEHEIEYLNLSGGEKTSVALAYRLSLNQIINNLITNIKTKDLIILDEPTDGFSYEQLDRIKLVLDELKVKQIILVSHEPKIESFVEHVIKLEKENHISRIIR